jgi:filamentous hemagglutinin
MPTIINYGAASDDLGTDRLRYFDNEFLVAQDFVDDQNFHIRQRRRTNRLLRVAGVAEGLTASLNQGSSPPSLTVKKGTAFDGDGNQILLAADRVVLLPVSLVQPQDLYIQFFDGESGNSQVTSEGGAAGPNRFVQSPIFAFVATPGTPTGGGVLLARVSNNGTTISDQRQFCGLSLPTSTGAPLSLRASTNTSFQNWAEVSGNLHVAGRTTLDALLTASAGLTINADSWMADQKLYLRAPGDKHHGVGWVGSWASQSLDGPVLFGNGSGGLGCNSNVTDPPTQVLALSWDKSQTVTVFGALTAQKTLTAPTAVVGGGAATQGASLTVNGVLAANGLLTANSGLTVRTGLLTASAGLTVNGAALTANVGLTVNNAALTANAGLTVTGALVANNALTVTGLLTANSGFSVGADSWMANTVLYFRPQGDKHHGVAWFGSYAGASLDGPVLFGNANGGLGCASNVTDPPTQSLALVWDSGQNVTVNGVLHANGGLTVRQAAGANLIPPGAVLLFNRWMGDPDRNAWTDDPSKLPPFPIGVSQNDFHLWMKL